MVDKGAAAPTVDTTRGGTTAVKGENTITLTNLSTGARDIYIVVKSLSNVECDPFKIEIPAYGSTETPDEGDFTITVNAPPTGGTIATNRTGIRGNPPSWIRGFRRRSYSVGCP